MISFSEIFDAMMVGEATFRQQKPGKVMEKLKTFVSSLVDLTESEWDFLRQAATVSTLKRGENLSFLTHKPRQMGFMFSGVVRSFVIEEDGKDYTWNFHFYSKGGHVNNLFVGDYASLLTDTDSILQFEVLQDCEIVFLPYSALTTLYHDSEKWERYGRKTTEQAYIIARERALTLLTKSAGQRLALLQRDFPSLFEKVPNYHIASFLGITPQTLSRLQREANI